MGIQATVKEIDDLFDELDENHSGTIELTELKMIGRKLQDKVSPIEQAKEKLEGEVNEMRKRALKTEQVGPRP